MTDIKLRPDCELAKAINEYGQAFHYAVRGSDVGLDNQMVKARAHLLEVIRRQLNLAGDASTYLEISNYDPIRAVQAAREEDGYGVLQRRIANEIMGVVSDD